MEEWRGKPFTLYDMLSNIFGRNRATGIGAQTLIDMVNDLNMEEQNEPIGVDDAPSPMSVNQMTNEHSTQSQSNVRRRTRPRDDLLKGFGEVAKKLFNKLVERFDTTEKNYPKYLAIELERLEFSVTNNFKISKAMKNDPSNMEIFKIIETDAEKVEFAMAFLNE